MERKTGRKKERKKDKSDKGWQKITKIDNEQKERIHKRKYDRMNKMREKYGERQTRRNNDRKKENMEKEKKMTEGNKKWQK